MAVRVRAKIEQRGVNPYVRVSAAQAKRIRKNWRRAMPVRFRINGEPETPWRVNLVPAGGGPFYLYLNGAVRRSSNSRVGDQIEVTLAFDDEYRGGPAHPRPAPFVEGLNRNPRALQSWRRLSPSRQKEMLRYIGRLKSPEARRRNVEKALQVLGGGRLRFLGRAWNEPEPSGIPDRPTPRRSKIRE